MQSFAIQPSAAAAVPPLANLNPASDRRLPQEAAAASKRRFAAQSQVQAPATAPLITREVAPSHFANPWAQATLQFQPSILNALTRARPLSLGERVVRWGSNLLRCFHCELKAPQRNYRYLAPESVICLENKAARSARPNTRWQPEVVTQTMALKTLAQRFQPRLFTMRSERNEDPSLRTHRIEYEVLPPSREKPYVISLIYYLFAHDEKHPNGCFNTLYGFLRPMLWGSKSDIEAVQVDVDVRDGQPVGVHYETALSPDGSYHYDALKNLHLLRHLEKQSDQCWKSTLHRSADAVESCTLQQSPVSVDSSDLNMVFVSWNGGIECCSLMPESDTYEALREQPTALPLIEKTYHKHGFDLRTGWLNGRKYEVCNKV